jgi:hypothetical protein
MVSRPPTGQLLKLHLKPKMAMHSLVVNVTNRAGRTYINGRFWNEFARVYNFKVGMELIFRINSSGQDTLVITGTEPLIHPGNFPPLDRMIDHINYSILCQLF